MTEGGPKASRRAGRGAFLLMMRLLGLLLLMGVLASLTAWLADAPGWVAIEWRGLRVETSAAALVVFLGLAIFSGVLLYRLFRRIRYGPAELRAVWRERRRRRGYLALTSGMAALAAGDGKEAQRLAREAERLIDDPAITLVLSAQAAYLEGDLAEARRYLEAMAKQRSTEFLGLRGLLALALREGDEPAARTLARRAFTLNPRAAWLNATLFELETRAGEWDRANRLIGEAAKARTLDREALRRRRAVLNYERALDEEEKGLVREAREHAEAAHRWAPDFTPAAALFARRLAAEGKRRRADWILARAWAREPKPELGAAFAGLLGEAAPAGRLRRLEKLAARNPDHPESLLLMAEAAIAAKDWKAARARLEKALEIRPSARAMRLMADLVRSESGNRVEAQEWLLRSERAVEDPAWVCSACGARTETHRVHCPNCRTFDGLRWREEPAHEIAGVGDAGGDGPDGRGLPAAMGGAPLLPLVFPEAPRAGDAGYEAGHETKKEA